MYLRVKVGTIIFCFRNETLQISCIRLLPKWLGFKKIFPKSPKETAGSYCKCLQGHKGVTTCVCALCIIVLFCSNLGVWEHLWDERGEPEKAIIRHLFLLASAGDLGGCTYDTIVISPAEGNHGLYWHLGKKTRVTSERMPGFHSKRPLNLISHYISNLITWWNVKPAGVPGCWSP